MQLQASSRPGGMKEQTHKRPMSLYKRSKCGIRSPGSEIASGTFLEVSSCDCSCPPLSFFASQLSFTCFRRYSTFYELEFLSKYHSCSKSSSCLDFDCLLGLLTSFLLGRALRRVARRRCLVHSGRQRHGDMRTRL